jgi:hypothetical protein
MCTSGDQLKVLLAKCARYLHQILFVRTSQFNLYTSICSYKMGVKYDIDFRTTVLASLSKRGDNGHQLLSANSMLQMAGRAGRRGIDELGHTVVVQKIVANYSSQDLTPSSRSSRPPTAWLSICWQ